MTTELLKLKSNDLEETIDLFIDTFTRDPWNDVYESRAQVEQFFERSLSNSYSYPFILKYEDKIVGLCLGYFTASLTGFEYYIDQFCISANHQGKKLGSIFIDKIDEALQEKDIEAITLTTSKAYPAAKFYEKNGFKEPKDVLFLFRSIKKRM